MVVSLTPQTHSLEKASCPILKLEERGQNFRPGNKTPIELWLYFENQHPQNKINSREIWHLLRPKLDTLQPLCSPPTSLLPQIKRVTNIGPFVIKQE